MSEIKLTLSRDEALVLFELLARWEDDDTLDGMLFDGEMVALTRLFGALERTLVAPFDPRYRTWLSHARKRLAARAGE